MDRRHLLQTTSLAAAASLLPGASAFAAPKNSPKIACFTKAFQKLDFAALSDQVKELGFDGLEAPIRPGGHVEPESVPDELPALIEELRRNDLEMTLLTSAITEVSDAQHTESLLKTAHEHGVQRYRMGYYKYDFARPIRDQIGEFKARLTDLAQLNREIGIQALYQNHAGSNYFGAPVWDLLEAIEDLPQEQIGLAYDIGHGTVEAGESWPVTVRAARERMGCVYVKDFGWTEDKKEKRQLGDGRVSEKFFEFLKKSAFSGPYSLHVEYIDRKDPEEVAKAAAAYRKDLKVLRKWIS